MKERAAEAKKLMNTAQRELYRAQEKYRAGNMERENARRRDAHYRVGETVLFYNRLPGWGWTGPSKLKLRRTALYDI